MSSTALVLPISGTQSPVGRAALAMLLFEDLALVPMLFLIGAAGGAATSGLGLIAIAGHAGHRRDPGGRPLRPAGAVRPGGAVEEARAVPRHLACWW